MIATTPAKAALITGVTGNDGACLSELLLSKGYEEQCINRRAILFNNDRIDQHYQDPHVDHQRFKLHCGELTDSTNLFRILGLQECLYLAKMSALRHWGDAEDHLEMQWLMLQQEQPENFVIATGVQYSVRDFVLETLLGDPTRARARPGWTPSTTVEALVSEVVGSVNLPATRDSHVKSAGFQTHDCHE